jgi:hypothetical protein
MGLFDAITQPIAGLFGGGGGGDDIPDPNIVKLTPEQEARINNYGADSRRSSQDLYKSNMQGVDKAAAMPTADMPSIEQQNASAGGNMAGMSQAIQNKYNNLTDQSMGTMKSQWQQQTELERADRLQQGYSLLSAKKQMDINNQKRLMDAQRRREAARSQAIGSIFGAIGMVGGAVAGAYMGGPWGAMAGAQAGSKLGQGLSGHDAGGENG